MYLSTPWTYGNKWRHFFDYAHNANEREIVGQKLSINREHSFLIALFVNPYYDLFKLV